MSDKRLQLREQSLKADKVMLILLGIQWGIATFISSITYHTYWFGFLSGGMMFLIPAILYIRYRGTRIFRIIIAISMMSFSVIFIQQHLGRIEMHFHVFVALAFLAYYKDTVPVVFATLYTVLYHLLFTYLQQKGVAVYDMPLMIYNYGCSWDITLLHAFFAISEGMVIGYMVTKQTVDYSELLDSKSKIQKLHDDLISEHQINQKLFRETKQLEVALDENSIVSRTDPKGRITYANEKFCKISGFSRDELIGKAHNIVKHPANPKSFYRELWDTIKAKKVFRGDLKNRAKDGGTYYVDMTIIPLLDEEGEIYEYLSVRHDISELIFTKNKLAKEQSKDRFLANMSHELRTPLNAIIGFMSLASKKEVDDEVKKYLDISLENSKQLLYLLNEILDIAKIKSGKFALDYAPFHLQSSLMSLTESFKRSAHEKGISFKEQNDTTLNRTLDGDWHRISQVITNLLSNAIKFTPEHGCVTLGASYKEGILTCFVEDTGIGLSDEAQERIFKEFEQADTSTTRKYGGTGLGLSISAELATMMQGSLSVQSQEGEGSTFTLQIPLTEVDIVANEGPQEVADSMDAAFAAHLLVVEDNKTNQMLIRLLLEGMGISCDIANDGVEALNMYEDGRYDMVLMDENMPNMGGIETMKRLRERFETMVPIIALTANTMKGDKERFLAAGMDDFIGKPVEHETLFAVLKRFLG